MDGADGEFDTTHPLISAPDQSPESPSAGLGLAQSDSPGETVSGTVPRHSSHRAGRTGRSRLGQHRPWDWKRLATSDVFLGLVLAILAWPTSNSSLIATPDLGSSWPAALTMAAHNHMAFGTHIVFTYGPLAFLVTAAMYYSSTAILAFLFTLAFTTALFAALVRSLRRTIPLSLAVAAAFVVGGVSRLSAAFYGTTVAVEEGLALVLIVCVSVLSRRQGDRAPAWVWIGLGGCLSIFSLIKVSLGIAVFAVILVTVICLPSSRRRAVAELALGAVPLFCLAWFGTGNGFQNLTAFVRSSSAIISGYALAMSSEVSTRWYSYWLAASVVVLHRRVRVRRFPPVDASITSRYRLGHTRNCVVSLQGGLRPARCPRLGLLRRRPPDPGGILDLVAFQSLAGLGHGRIDLRDRQRGRDSSGIGLPAVPGGTEFRLTEATTLASSSKRQAVIDESRRSLQAQYGLTPEMLTLMRGKTVDVSPWEQTVVWAYPQLRFDPLPVIGDYSAYTPYLDQLDTSYLVSPTAPEYILRQPLLAIDGRNPSFEPPAAQLAIECRYHQVAATASWQLLQHQPDRCGRPQPLGAITTGLLRRVKVLIHL